MSMTFLVPEDLDEIRRRLTALEQEGAPDLSDLLQRVENVETSLASTSNAIAALATRVLQLENDVTSLAVDSASSIESLANRITTLEQAAPSVPRKPSMIRADGSLQTGIYFNKQDGTLAQTILQQFKLTGLQVGDIIVANAQTTVSCLANSAYSYGGFNSNTFTAAQILLKREQQNTWLNNQTVAKEISRPTGQDIQNGSSGGPMQPYLDHDHVGLYEIKPGEEGDWWVVFTAWCSSSAATGDSIAKNEYLLCFPQQTSMQALVIPR